MIVADPFLSRLSDLLVPATIGLYVLAMLGYAVRLGFGGTVAAAGRTLSSPVRSDAPATALAWLGWGANLGAVVSRGLATGRWPWGNMYEFVIASGLFVLGGVAGALSLARVRFVAAGELERVALLFNLVGVNIFIPGLHSYADMPK